MHQGARMDPNDIAEQVAHQEGVLEAIIQSWLGTLNGGEVNVASVVSNN